MCKNGRRKVITVRNIGFCTGIERAVEMTEEAVSKFGKVYTLDALLHNEEEMNRLKKMNVMPVNNLHVKGGDVILLPAHGSTNSEVLRANKNFNEVIDTICPLVLKTVKIIQKLKTEGYKIAIVGDRGHREVDVLSDVAGENLLGVFQNKSEVSKNLAVSKVGVVAQSTILQETLFSVARKFIEFGKEVRFFNTICEETLKRQSEAKKIAKEVGCMIVIGGKASANSRRLYEMVKKINKNSYFIQNENDLSNIPFTYCDIVGVASGTSTPLWLINKVVRRLGQ